MFNEIYELLKKHRRHGENFIWRSIQYIGKMVLDLLVFYIIVRLLTPEKFGQYSYLIALVGLFVTFGNFGLSTSVSKYIAEYQVKDEAKVKSILFSSLILSTLFCFIVSIAIFILGFFFFFDYYEFVGYLVTLIFLISGSNILDGVYRGLMKFKKLSFVSIISFIIRIPLTYFFVLYFEITGALWAQIFFYIISFVLLILYSKQKSLIFDKKIALEVFKYAIVIGIAGLAYFLYTNIDILFLEHYGYIIEIGDYKIASRFLELTYILFVVLGQVLAPAITKLVTRKQFVKFRKLLSKLTYIFGLGIIISILSYFIFPISIQIFFPEYYSTNILLIWNLLLFLIPFKCVGVILIQGFLVPAGLGKITMQLTLIGGISNVILDYLFIEWFGFLGIIYSTLIIHSITICLTFIIFYRKISGKWSY
ncbi:MAG: oligosaccharide flippase family protein [Candidatus Lokiarchaeota archaeon]|nr:oligosaccharide flippase family protein [Candidatus Lokiarchaeota archaeon]